MIYKKLIMLRLLFVKNRQEKCYMFMRKIVQMSFFLRKYDFFLGKKYFFYNLLKKAQLPTIKST